MNEAIQRFVDELAADPTVRGVILFGSHARGNARPDSDADPVILVERDQFAMGFVERDGQKFELIRWSKAVAIRYAVDYRDSEAVMLADGKPPMDETRRAWSRWASEDRLDAAGIAEDDPTAAGLVLHERSST